MAEDSTKRKVLELLEQFKSLEENIGKAKESCRTVSASISNLIERLDVLEEKQIDEEINRIYEAINQILNEIGTFTNSAWELKNLLDEIKNKLEQLKNRQQFKRETRGRQRIPVQNEDSAYGSATSDVLTDSRFVSVTNPHILCPSARTMPKKSYHNDEPNTCVSEISSQQTYGYEDESCTQACVSEPLEHDESPQSTHL